ncbi:type IV pilus biogenesis protein PilP [Actimicrobium antarcticum]
MPRPSGAAETTAESLTRIEAETLVLKAQERQLAVKTKILQLQADITARQNNADQSARPGAPGDPTVQSIEGVGNVVHATLQFENGSSIDVKVGDTLPNGMRVLSVNTNEVIVSADKRNSVRLLPGTAAVVAAASGGVPTNMALPAMGPASYPGVPRLPIKGAIK